jgi:MEDS: MEthanogen/methylotroph, DcmR Sensory domain
LNSIDNKNGILNIEEGSVLNILDKFKKQSNFGEHSILIYPDRYALREVYSRACKIALENNEAVIMLLHYDTRDNVKTYLKELDIDVYNYEKKERSLLIVDSVLDYFGSAQDFLFYLNLMNVNASKRNKRGILVLMDAGFHYHHHHQTNNQIQRINSLMEYEELLPAKLNLNVKILCLYHVKDFDVLEQTDQKEYLLKLHFRRYKVKDERNPSDKASDNNNSIFILCCN